MDSSTLIKRLETAKTSFQNLELQLADPDVASDPKQLERIARERSRLEPLVNDYFKLQIIEKEFLEAKGLLKESRDDKEMELLAREELQNLELSKNELIQKLTLALLPKDPRDEKSVMLEIRAGAGGETNIFFADSDSGLGSYQGIIQYAHASNQFNFFTNGTQRVRIHNGGGVQLISSTPTSTNPGWTVYGGDTTTSYSTLNTHFPTTNRMMLMAGHPTNESSFVVWNKGDANAAKAFGISNAGVFKYVHGASELVRFQPDGNVNFAGAVLLHHSQVTVTL